MLAVVPYGPTNNSVRFTTCISEIHVPPTGKSHQVACVTFKQNHTSFPPTPSLSRPSQFPLCNRTNFSRCISTFLHVIFLSPSPSLLIFPNTLRFFSCSQNEWSNITVDNTECMVYVQNAATLTQTALFKDPARTAL